MVEQSGKKIWKRVTRFKIKVRFQISFFLTVIFNWVNIASAWSWTYWLAFHIYILDLHHTRLLGTECCDTFRLATSLRIFLFQNCLVLLYSNAMFQLMSRWPRRCFHSTSPTYEIHQLFPSQWTNERVFVPFLVKFLTKYHSDSVSIETSEPFSWSQHFSLAALQLIFSSWKVYFEQTVTNVYGSRPIKEKKDKQGKIIYLLIF